MPKTTEPNLIKPLALITNLQEIYRGEESVALCYGIISKIQTWVNSTKQPGFFNKYITRARGWGGREEEFTSLRFKIMTVFIWVLIQISNL